LRKEERGGSRFQGSGFGEEQLGREAALEEEQRRREAALKNGGLAV
jgi:hypothetical protein